MYIVVIFSLVSLVILQGCNLETTADSLTGNEKRLADFRRDFEADSSAFETLDIAHVGPNKAATLTADNTNETLDASAVLKSSPNKLDTCCQVGQLLAERGLHCKRYRFSQASRRMKLKLVNATLIRLHIHIDETNRHTIYNPFRICILRSARDIDKCCLLNEHASGGHNKKEGDSGASDKGYVSRHGLSRFDSGDSMKRAASLSLRSRTLNGRVSNRGHGEVGFEEGLHRENYNWKRWAAYRSYRARKERLTKLRTFKRG